MTTAITDPTTSNLAYASTGANNAPSVVGDPIRAKLKANTNIQLTLLTNEGDVVTISGRSSLRMSYGGYDRHGRYDNADTTTLRASFRQQLTLSVQGTLSDQELADIDHLLGTIEDAFNQAMTALPDDLAGAGLSLGTLDGLDSITAVTGSLTYSSKLSATYRVAGSPSTAADDAPSSDTGDGAGAPAVHSVADALVRVKSTYQVSQQIAMYRLVTEQAPEPDAAAPVAGTDPAATPTTTGSPASATPVSDTTTPSTTLSATPAADVAGALPDNPESVTPSTTEADAPTTTSPPADTASSPTTEPVVSESPVDPIAQAAASQIATAIGTARDMTSVLFDTITKFLDGLVGQVADQAGTDSLTLHLAQSIRMRVVQHLSTQTPAETPAPVTAGNPSSPTSEPTTATTSSASA